MQCETKTLHEMLCMFIHEYVYVYSNSDIKLLHITLLNTPLRILT